MLKSCRVTLGTLAARAPICFNIPKMRPSGHVKRLPPISAVMSIIYQHTVDAALTPLEPGWGFNVQGANKVNYAMVVGFMGSGYLYGYMDGETKHDR